MVVAESGGDGAVVIIIREYNPKTDSHTVEQVERSCEVGPSGEYSLHADLLGDPICRVRNSPAYLMLVAEMAVTGTGDETTQIVGMIRGCIKTVTCGRKLCRKPNFPPEPLPVFTKLAYILGLRVSPSHRRMKIGLKLVCRMEAWFKDNGAEYSYIATDAANKPSVNLFTEKCGYSKFRNPSVLVHPVFNHRLRINNRLITIVQLSPADAETIYRQRFSTTEFFPRDIDSVLKNNLNLGTFLAIPKDCPHAVSWGGSQWFLSDPPESWAIMSVWNCNDVFKLEVKGASRLRKGFVKTTRVLDGMFPFLNLPSLPKIFNPFGLHLVYGLGGEGPWYLKLAKALFGYAHNLAKESRCGVVATEVSSGDPLRVAIPHWKALSFADLWCIKRLDEDYSEGFVGDWRKSESDVSFFLDPREF